MDEDEVAENMSDSLCFQLQPMEVDNVTEAVMQQWHLWSDMSFLDEDLGFWIKPQSTTWFSRFLIEEYDDERWVRMFRMTKRSVLSLASLLKAGLEKKDTNYYSAIPALVRVACSLFKFCHGSSLLLCNELFAVEQSTVSIMLCDFVEEVNIVFRFEISWPMGDTLFATAAGFYQLCSLPSISGTIDGTYFRIKKNLMFLLLNTIILKREAIPFNAK